MKEPLYEYVKGQGWIVQMFQTVECVSASGQRMRLEFRKPEIGERFNYHNGPWPIPDWVNWVSMYEYVNAFSSLWSDGKFYRQDTMFCVGVLLD